MSYTALQLGKELNKVLRVSPPIPLDNEKGAQAEIEAYAHEITVGAFEPKKLSVLAAKTLMDYPLTDDARAAAKAIIKKASGKRDSTPRVVEKVKLNIISKTKVLNASEIRKELMGCKKVISTKPLKISEVLKPLKNPEVKVDKPKKVAKKEQAPDTSIKKEIPKGKMSSIAKFIKQQVAKNTTDGIAEYITEMYKNNGKAEQNGEAWLKAQIKCHLGIARRMMYEPVNLRKAVVEKFAAGETEKAITAYCRKIYAERGKTNETVIAKAIALYLSEAEMLVEAVKTGLANRKDK